MLLNSKYINIDFPKQQLWPPLRDSKPVCYATLIHNDDEVSLQISDCFNYFACTFKYVKITLYSI